MGDPGHQRQRRVVSEPVLLDEDLERVPAVAAGVARAGHIEADRVFTPSEIEQAVCREIRDLGGLARPGSMAPHHDAG